MNSSANFCHKLSTAELSLKLQNELSQYLKMPGSTFSIPSNDVVLGVVDEEINARINGLGTLIMDPFWLRASSGSVIPDLAESLKGKKSGEQPKFAAENFAFKGKILTEFSRKYPDLRPLINQLSKKNSPLADQAATFLNDAIQPSVARYLGLVERGISLNDIFKFFITLCQCLNHIWYLYISITFNRVNIIVITYLTCIIYFYFLYRYIIKYNR